MIILPDKNISRAKFLPPVAMQEWREPSQAQSKDQFGNRGVDTRFRIRARLDDGHVAWCGWFDDRDDFDAFLFALVTDTLSYEKELWRLPSPWWDAGLGKGLSYDFATVTFLTSPTGSNQTYTSPVGWNNSNNSIECLGSGASGGVTSTGHSTGAGAASYSAIANFSFAVPGTTTATYQIATLTPGQSGSAIDGNSGGDTWFNAAAYPGAGSDNSKCGAKGGVKGVNGAGSRLGGVGGPIATSWGQTKFAGGRGGNMSGASGTGASGGGGAAGPAGAGGDGVDSASTGSNIITAGGTANNGATAGGTTNGATGNPGNAGTDWDATHGLGSGGAAAANAAGSSQSGGGALYGGASGGAQGSAGADTFSGKQGLIVITFTPAPMPSFPTRGNRRIFTTFRSFR